MESQFAEFNRVANDLSFKALSDLRKLVVNVPNNEDLFSESAHYERLDKLVLWNSGDKQMQIRLHVYADKCCNKNVKNLADISDVHNHPWSFSTRILSGGYSHTIYRTDLIEGEHSLVPTMIRYEGIGSCYALHHSQYHSIIEKPNTVSLIIRGPKEKKSFQVIKETKGKIESKDSLTLQSPEEKEKRKMKLADYEKVLDHLVSLKII